MFSLFKQKEQHSLLKSEAVSVVRQVRSVAQRAVEHTSALGALFSAEVKEYASVQVCRLAMVVAACVLLLGAYLLLCALLVVVLLVWMPLAWALGCVFLLNLAVAVCLLLLVKYTAGKKLAPATVEELKNDWQCLKLLCKENKEH